MAGIAKTKSEKSTGRIEKRLVFSSPSQLQNTRNLKRNIINLIILFFINLCFSRNAKQQGSII